MDFNSPFKPPCSSRWADAVIRGSLVGFTWGVFFHPQGDLDMMLQSRTSMNTTEKKPTIKQPPKPEQKTHRSLAPDTSAMRHSRHKLLNNTTTKPVTPTPSNLDIAVKALTSPSTTSSTHVKGFMERAEGAMKYTRGAMVRGGEIITHTTGTIQTTTRPVLNTLWALPGIASVRQSWVGEVGPRLRSGRRASFLFALFCGSYAGVVCGMESITRREHWAHEAVAGAVSGALVSAKRAPRTIAIVSLTSGTCTGFISYLLLP